MKICGSLVEEFGGPILSPNEIIRKRCVKTFERLEQYSKLNTRINGNPQS